MIDAFIPEGALDAASEERLLADIVEILIRLDGFEPTNERARAATWVFVNRPEVFRPNYAAGKPSYRFVVSFPEGQYNDAVCSVLVREVTEAVARAEGGH